MMRAEALGGLILGLVLSTGCGSMPPLRTGFSDGLQTPVRSPPQKTDPEHFKDGPEYEPTASEKISMIWPVKTGRLTQPFKDDSNGHWGIDIAAPVGTKIYASHSGQVIYSGRGFRGYGKFIIIESGEIATFYSHCHKLFVKQGQWVKQGTVIGVVGRTGNASGPHLHFEVRRNRMPVDPMFYLPR